MVGVSVFGWLDVKVELTSVSYWTFVTLFVLYRSKGFNSRETFKTFYTCQ